jgi:hypothetical protein
VISDESRSFVGDDPGPEEMPDVRGQRVDRAFVAVEPDHVEAAALLRPEVLVEAGAEQGGLVLEALRKFVPEREPVRELCDAELRVVDVSLDLGRCDRQVRDGSIGELHAVP